MYISIYICKCIYRYVCLSAAAAMQAPPTRCATRSDIHIYIHTYVFTFIFIYAYVYIDMCVYVNVHIHMGVYMFGRPSSSRLR